MPTKPSSLPDFKLIEELASCGYHRIIGIDEVGRGALAGPVVVAAVEITVDIGPLNDSKKLSALKRLHFSQLIRRNALQLSIASSSQEEIDQLGLAKALNLAYDRALKTVEAELVLTDAYQLTNGLNFISTIGGDGFYYPISAASIVAKVYRDQLMRTYSRFHPQYGWETNVGYGTSAHLQAIRDHGLTNLHRVTFIK